MANHLNAGVRITVQAVGNSLQIIAQSALHIGAVGCEQDVLRHGDDQAVASVGDADIAVQLLTQLCFLLVQIVADGRPNACANSRPNDGPFLVVVRHHRA